MRTDIRRIILAVLGVAAAVVAVLASVTLANRPPGLADLTVSDPLGWAIPIVSVFVILAVGWLLMSQAPRERQAGPQRTVTCGACGRSVLADWRLCPYCGVALAPDVTADLAAEGDAVRG